MTQKVLDYIRKQHMLTGGEKVLVGLSGGADSVALLHFLISIQQKYSLGLVAVHVNHGIRQEAGEDEAFCERLCKEWGVPFECRRIEPGKLAQAKGAGLEEEARTARYELLEQCCRECGCDRIAVAHHANDNAETMLFQLFRGSGLKGLAGIPPVREHIIRPFLCVSREEISQYLWENGLEHVEDASNQDLSYTRNRLRAQVIPLSEEICEGAVEHMSRCAGQMRDVWEYLNGQAKAFLDQNAVSEEDCIVISPEKLKALPIALQREVLMESVARVCDTRKDISFINIENIRELSDKNGQKDCKLPYGLMARKSYNELRIYKRTGCGNSDQACRTGREELNSSAHRGCNEAGVTKETYLAPDTYKIPADGKIMLPDGNSFIFQVLSADIKNENFNNIPQNDCTKWFDYDKINDHLLLRHRRPGDYLVVRADGGRKSLQDYLINEKVPREFRERLWLLADGSHILWVVGYRISMEYKVTRETKKILEVHLEEKANGGEN
ncbi:MAG: tRNA lysidine(34) synthetase TilS [Lachnospiraceae bacterium]|nr:tRNA lysidine(34) synthetase TilS [Lachnospiraceae bacterium]